MLDNDQDLQKLVLAMTRKMLMVEARCDVLEAVVRGLAKKHGVPEERMKQVIRERIAARYQTYLEIAETLNPLLGALLDTRPDIPELPDDLDDL